ncbi:MAG: prefoldin subunit beta [Halobacteria archaeon]
MAANLPPQVQNQLVQLRQLQQQAQSVALQKSQVDSLLRETESALAELEKIGPDDTIYRAAGTVLMKAKRDEVKANLAEKKETYSLRLKTLERQEERIKKRGEELQQQLQQSLKSAGVAGPAAG